MFVSPLLALTLSLALPVAACVDPQKDFNDYASRTADAHAAPVTTVYDSGAEAAPLYAPDASFMGSTFLMSCLSGDANGDVSKANLFVANMKFTPSPGGGGSLNFANADLKYSATTLSDTTGMVYPPLMNPVPVNPDGTASVSWGMTTIPADANPVTEMTLVLKNTTLTFHIESESQICCSLNGYVESPVAKPITAACVFQLIPSVTSPLPTFQLSDYHCP